MKGDGMKSRRQTGHAATPAALSAPGAVMALGLLPLLLACLQLLRSFRLTP
jgi:hypothetical protein